MNIEKGPQSQEEEKITPEKELEYAEEGLAGKDQGEVGNCLSEFSGKVAEAGLSAEKKAEMKARIEKIESACQEADIPEEGRKYVELMIQRAKEALE